MWPFRRRSAASGRPVAPIRAEASIISHAQALKHSAVYRAVSIICTAMTQLPLRHLIDGKELARPADIVRRPDPAISRDEWTERLTLSLVMYGEAYLRVYRDEAGQAVIARPVDPADVSEYKPGRYTVRGVKLPKDAIVRASLIRPLGAAAGISPLQAAMSSISVAMDLRTYIGGWFRGTGQPAGVLTSDSALTAAEARAARNRWNNLDDEGNPIDDHQNPTRVKVLGKGLTYKPLLLSPTETLWLEQQDSVNQEVARIFGLPPALMLVSPGSGTSLSYANVSQEWAGFARFGLMPYIKKIEGMLTSVLPPGHAARYDIEGLLRADTESRYQAYKMAIEGGWMSADEVRELEGIT